MIGFVRRTQFEVSLGVQEHVYHQLVILKPVIDSLSLVVSLIRFLVKFIQSRVASDTCEESTSFFLQVSSGHFVKVVLESIQ